MKKIFLSILLFYLLTIIFVPSLTKAGLDPACQGKDGSWGIVLCGCGKPITDSTGRCTNCCEVTDFFGMLARIYSFIVWYIATPLAVLALSIGAIFMLAGAGNPNLFATGKKILYAAIIGLVLVFCSWLIIDFILTAIGYNMGKPWWQL